MEERKETVLVVGGSGFVGKALLQKLTQQYSVIVTSRDKDFVYPGVRILYGDLTDESFCIESLFGIDNVLYIAGYKKNIAHHVAYPYDFVIGNVDPLITFIKALQHSSVKRIVYLSSSNVGLYNPGERDGYVVGKYINELILNAFAQQYPIKVCIMRSVGVYGPGDNFNPDTANFIPAMIEKVYNSTGSVEVWGSGIRQMQFIYIDDLVNNLISVMKNSCTCAVVSHPQSLTINEIVEKIIKLSGKELVIKHNTMKPDKPSVLFEIHNECEPKVSFDEGLQNTLQFYKEINKI